MATENVFEFLSGLIKNADKIFYRTKQDGKFRTIALTQVKDQRTVAMFFINQLEEYRDAQKPTAESVEEGA